MHKLILSLVLAVALSGAAIHTAAAAGGGQSPTTIGNNQPTINIVFTGWYKGKGAAGGPVTEVGNAFDPAKAGGYDDAAARKACLAAGGNPVRRFVGDGFYWVCGK